MTDDLPRIDAIDQLNQVGDAYTCAQLDNWDGLVTPAAETEQLKN